MSKWEQVKLDNLCVKKIETLSTKDNFIIEYVDISSIDNQEKRILSYQTINSCEAPSRAKQILQKGDILISTVRPNLNAIAINHIDSEHVVVGSTGFCVLRCNEGIDTNYIFNFCKSKKFFNNLARIAKGASYPAVSNKQVRDSKILLPPLEKQKQIAKILDTAAELLAMHKQQLTELDNLIKSIFYDMFGDPVVNERGWDIVPLRDTLSIIGGYAFKSSGFTKEGIPVIKIGNINSGIFSDTNISFWEYDEKLEKYSLYPNNVVISLTGTVGKDDYANVCILPDLYPQYYLNQRNAKLELHESINVHYLIHLLRDPKIKGKLTGINRGIRQANISNTDILSLNVPLPPISIQEKFSTIIVNIEEQKNILYKAIEETKYLFDALMADYFE
ncbi:restriction endonuclease subunit S [Paenibacillus apiarius]|uniref:restriction endonuclease subunit S n=1 Tax=Paenibacillus apiarius TaxID=46240 RepID=UPI003B3BB095